MRRCQSWLARTRSRWKNPVAVVVALPLVLPPTVLGFYLLLLMGPNGPVGKLTQALGIGLLPFSFEGLVVAIPAMVAFSFFRNRIDTLVSEAGKKVEQVLTPLGRRRV